MRRVRRNNFTLIEIMAVITIFMVVSAVAAARLRTDRTTARIESTLLEFRRYAARLRNFAMQNDCSVRILLDPETQEITAEKVTDASGASVAGDEAESSDLPYPVILDVMEEPEPLEVGETPPPELAEKERRFVFPAKLKPELRAEGAAELNLGESLELWRFLPSGEAVLHTPLVVTFGEAAVRSVTVSDFSGQLVVQKGDVTEERDAA